MIKMNVSCFSYSDMRRQREKNAKLKDLAFYAFVGVVGLGTIGELQIKPMIKNWEYNHAPVINYTIQEGDKIEKLLRAEGLDTNEKLNKGMKTLQDTNGNYYVGWDERNLENLNKIKTGKKIYWRDFNKDHKVGYHNKVYPWAK